MAFDVSQNLFFFFMKIRHSPFPCIQKKKRIIIIKGPVSTSVHSRWSPTVKSYDPSPSAVNNHHHTVASLDVSCILIFHSLNSSIDTHTAEAILFFLYFFFRIISPQVNFMAFWFYKSQFLSADFSCY